MGNPEFPLPSPTHSGRQSGKNSWKRKIHNTETRNQKKVLTFVIKFFGCKCCYHRRRRKAQKEVTACRAEIAGWCITGEALDAI